VGGLVGYNFFASVSNCYSSGFVTGDKNFVGGLVGMNYKASIRNSYSSANTSGEWIIGGLVGNNSDSSSVTNCYSTGNVSGDRYIGGLAGYNFGGTTVTNSYSTGSVTGTLDIGGLVGFSNSSVSNSFWDTQTSGLLTSAGGSGKTSTEMKNPVTYVNARWKNSVWHMGDGINNGYPYLSWQKPDGTPLPLEMTVAPLLGNGTIGNPYQIASLENLYWIGTNTANLDKYYIQTANINASATKDWFKDKGWKPIGNHSFPFTGSYNGKGYIIDSLFIYRTESDTIGLFGYINNHTIIDSLGMTNAQINGGSFVGGLVGYTYTATINSCFTTGAISGVNNVGGLSGYEHYLTLSNCYSTANVSGEESVGGLAGQTMLDVISNCFATGLVLGTDNVGGLIGLNTITAIYNCYSTGNVNGNSKIGGLIGYNSNSSSVNTCYSAGNVTGIDNTGGLVGDNISSYVTNCFWDTETSGQSYSDGGTGKTSVEMKTKSTFTDAGWNESFWYFSSRKNDGYPYLYYQFPKVTPTPSVPSSGNGTIENPYQIATLENLYWITSNSANWDKHYLQTANINASSTFDWINGGWVPVANGSPYFTGSYNGKGHTIDSLFINKPTTDDIGFFGFTSGATIDSLAITHAEFAGRNYVGGIVGRNFYSEVKECYFTGSVTGLNDVGGIAGYNHTSTLNNCYSIGKTNGAHYSGGMVGTHDVSSVVNNCYAACSVTGTDNLGGLVGRNASSTVSGSFWDTEISGQSSSAGGGTGKTTAEMKTKSTFTNAGWDFTNETLNGDANIWGLYSHVNDGYPFLSWQVHLNKNNQISDSTLSSGESACFNAYVTLTLAGPGTPVDFQFGSTATLIAGQSIRFLPGFHAHNGSQVSAWITTDGTFCEGAAASPVILPEEKSSPGVIATQPEKPAIKEKGFKVYPNPNNGEFVVELTGFDSAKLQLFNVTGRIIYQVKQVHQKEIALNLSHLEHGIYLLKVSDHSKQIVKKIIISK